MSSDHLWFLGVQKISGHMVQILTHFYFILQLRCVKPFKTFSTIHENRVKSSGFAPFFFFFLSIKFYELHTVAGQKEGLNKLMNGFYCT